MRIIVILLSLSMAILTFSCANKERKEAPINDMDTIDNSLDAETTDTLLMNKSENDSLKY
ncbi:hypothetical protein JGH11_08590 [Dysgonomonas sp. Marseille-P4677]|uniref:hypothetical protein n=1 Tax=Dysgonomonas sp. Marseille-P4677 TaxID=2364790 RepID=UPI00191135B3|nr:hypothetical protein [Dysgonomonas sp. Marseille-P4677]MBK5720926.1 hypothetical protein [Dysgonomonas sp. Marseille-P4677]